MGLTPRKGAIAIGADADLAIVDLNQRWTMGLDNVISSAGFSVFTGQAFDARVIHSFVRGAPTMIDLALVPAAVGKGRFCGRSLQNVC
jgi:dihydropyrimidinase